MQFMSGWLLYKCLWQAVLMIDDFHLNVARSEALTADEIPLDASTEWKKFANFPQLKKKRWEKLRLKRSYIGKCYFRDDAAVIFKDTLLVIAVFDSKTMPGNVKIASTGGLKGTQKWIKLLWMTRKSLVSLLLNDAEMGTARGWWMWANEALGVLHADRSEQTSLNDKIGVAWHRLIRLWQILKLVQVKHLKTALRV